MSALELRIQKSYELSYQMAELLETQAYKSEREKLALSAMYLSQDHHMSVVALMKLGRYSSAAALLRPIGEATASAYWFTYVADGQRLARMLESHNEREDVPNLDDMVRALSVGSLDIPGIKGLHQLIKSQSSLWRRFHKFTHGGITQLRRRTEPESFTVEENSYHLMVADSFMLPSVALAAHIFQSSALSDFSDRSYRFLIKDVESYGMVVPARKALPSVPDLD